MLNTRLNRWGLELTYRISTCRKAESSVITLRRSLSTACSNVCLDMLFQDSICSGKVPHIQYCNRPLRVESGWGRGGRRLIALNKSSYTYMSMIESVFFLFLHGCSDVGLGRLRFMRSNRIWDVDKSIAKNTCASTKPQHMILPAHVLAHAHSLNSFTHAHAYFLLAHIIFCRVQLPKVTCLTRVCTHRSR